MEQNKNQQEKDKDMNDKSLSSENLDKPEFDVPDTERKSDEMTANDNQRNDKSGSGGGTQSGKVSSTEDGNQVRGGDETYSNIYKGKDSQNKENKSDSDKNENEGKLGNRDKEYEPDRVIGKENRGTDNKIDDRDDEVDSGNFRSGVDDKMPE